MTEVQSAKETVSLVISGITIIGVIFAIYKYFREPDIKMDKEVAVMKKGCEDKHQNIDQRIGEINKSIDFIKNNHLRHIESDVAFLKEKHIEMFTMLNERLPKKS